MELNVFSLPIAEERYIIDYLQNGRSEGCTIFEKLVIDAS